MKENIQSEFLDLKFIKIADKKKGELIKISNK
jgi:hypothetical protein